MSSRARPKPLKVLVRAAALGILLLVSAPAVPASAGESPAGTDLSQSGTGPPAPAEAPQARSAVDFWERLPAPTALLIPVAVGLAVLVGVTLGPEGRPAPVLRREGGLSRALARRSAAGRDDA